MTRRYVVITVCILGVLAAWWTGAALMQHLAYVRDLEEFRARELRHWVSTQRGMAHSLDRACAEILVADTETLGSALRSAGEQAYAAREALWSASPLAGMDSTIYRWNLHQHYERMGSYLNYLAQRDGGLDLNDVERSNVDLMREYAVLLHAGFDAVLARLQEETETREGYTRIIYTNWSRIARDEEIPAVLEQLGRDLSLKDEVGGDDSAHREYWDRRRSASAGAHGLLQSGEEELDENEMLNRAVMFLQSLGIDEIVDDGGTVLSEASTSATGHGTFFPVGPYTHFTLKDGSTGCRYRVGVTQVGGHVISLQVNEYPNDMNSVEEALDFSLFILKRWQELETVSLEIVEEHTRDGFQLLSHAPKVDGIIYSDSTVEVVIALDEMHSPAASTSSLPGRPALELDARRYFATYGSPRDLRPEITPGQAVAALAPTLTVTGEPRLEARGGNLRYVIPVTGVQRVTAVYLDAITGKYDGMLYSIRDDGAVID